jgi:Protein of unknown function (DUF669)
MASLQGFNANNVEPGAPMGPMPKGDYLAIITESERKPNSQNTGEIIKLVFRVVQECEYKGRQIFENFNIVNQNPVAQKIAYEQLAKVCLAVGKPEPGTTEALHNIPMIVSVVNDKPNQDGDIYNKIRDWKHHKLTRNQTPQQPNNHQQYNDPRQPQGNQQPSNPQQPGNGYNQGAQGPGGYGDYNHQPQEEYGQGQPGMAPRPGYVNPDHGHHPNGGQPGYNGQ